MDNVFWQKAWQDLQESEQLFSEDTNAMQNEWLLEQRALQLAETSQLSVQSDTSLFALLIFHVANERYAIDVKHIIHITRQPIITPLPCVPDFYRGVANINGAVITILDLAQFFNISHTATLHQDDAHVIVVRAADIELGLWVDDVLGVNRFTKETFDLSADSEGDPRDHIAGIASDGLVLLDLPQILTDSRLFVDEEPT